MRRAVALPDVSDGSPFDFRAEPGGVLVVYVESFVDGAHAVATDGDVTWPAPTPADDLEGELRQLLERA